MKTHTLLAMTVGALLLLAAAPSQAIYIATPLQLDCTDKVANGDSVDFTVGPSPDNESARSGWAGKTVKIGYSYDKNEGQGGDDPDAPASNDGYTEGHIGTITLDDKASGSFTWTLPAEVNDRNVQVFLEDADGERLAFAYVAVGDATPMMHIASSGPGNPEIDPNGNTGTDDEGDDRASEEAPATGLVALMAAVALAALGIALARRE